MRPRPFLVAAFAVILGSMIAITIYASAQQSVWDAGADLVNDRWFLATLADAYFGFLTFYAWVFYKERTTVGRVTWFLLIMALGNIAMSIYVLIQLATWTDAPDVSGLLLRSDRAEGGMNMFSPRKNALP